MSVFGLPDLGREQAQINQKKEKGKNKKEA